MYLTSSFRLRAGTNSLEDYYLLSVLGNKPYTHLGPHSIGVMVAYFYMQILKYRKVLNDEDKNSQYPKIRFLHTNRFVMKIILFLGILGIIICFVDTY